MENSEQYEAEKSNGNLRYWASFATIALCIFLINYLTQAYHYADYDTYVLYLDTLVHFPPANWYYFEPLSNFYLLTIHWVTNSVEPSISIAHQILGIFFLILLFRSSPPEDSSWQTLLFTFAVLGPLLAFVTLRATPAYFLVAISVRYAVVRSPRAAFYFILATLFHASALLAAIPLLLLYFEDRLPAFAKMNKSPRLLISGIAVVALIGILSARLSGSAISVIQSIPILSKYVAYTADVSINKTSSISHYIFLAFSTMITIIFFTNSARSERNINGYILISFAIYLILFFVTSPVAAFRQTSFWLIPMISLFPWRRVGIRDATAPLFVIFCFGLFYFQFNQVYS